MKYSACLLLFIPLTAALWPIPPDTSVGTATVWIDQNVNVQYSGGAVDDDVSSQPSRRFSRRQSNSTKCPTADNIVGHAVERTQDTIFNKTFVPWKFYPRGSNWEPVMNTTKPVSISEINLVQTADDPVNMCQRLAGEVDESYELDVTADGETTITAATSIGIARGLTTFSQLFFKHSMGGVYMRQAPVKITDKPKFSHRGLNLDVSRNFFPVNDILRTIDALAFNKMNRFHIHITDAQSWPLEIPSIPTLASKGSYAPGLAYSPRDIEVIQLYGALNGVQIIFEIDMPGHTSSIHHSFPDLIAAFNVQPDWDSYCAEPPCGTLKLNSPAVDSFLNKLFADLMPRLNPYSGYFHTGGDEVNKKAYSLDNTVNSSDISVLQPLMQQFVDKNHQRVRAAGLTPIVWEEMLLDWNITLGQDVIVQTWQSDEAVAAAVKKGFKTLAGNYNYWYLDCGRGQWINFKQGAPAQNAWPYKDYCDPVKNWRLIYSYDPLSGVPAESSNLVLGGEVHLWAEQTDTVNLDRMIWPRAAAAAEVLWSGAKDASGQNRSQEDAALRLSELRERLVARGIAAEPIQMPFCLQNGAQCSL